MLDKLEAIKNRFDEVSELIVDPNIISDMKQYIQLNKEYKDLQPIIESYHKYKNILSNIENAKEMLKDDDVDLVFVTTQHHMHAKMVIETISSGKSVFVEILSSGVSVLKMLIFYSFLNFCKPNWNI